MQRFDPQAPWPQTLDADPQDARDAQALRVPPRFFDPAYERPIPSRYVDPLEVVWLATIHRLGMHFRRDPDIFSMTDGQGLLALSTRDDLDEDDNLCQMALHEICHWVTNGLSSFHERDWGFPLWDEIDVREYGCLRLQAWLGQRWGMREMMGPTGGFRQYYDRLPADPLAPLDDSPWEAAAVRIGRDAVARVQQEPWWTPISAAMDATAALRGVLAPFAGDYRPEDPADRLPLWWGTRHPTDEDGA